ncbi:LacI family DNA-binding transcriptional regulator [Sphingomonas koreensis]|nr:LacI family DNA-binding transcriptional regulator [Sphingomonas koreensis]
MARARRKNRGTTTILDVATAAGVSSMTVSRVVNGAPSVRDTTRRRVLDAIAELKYSPNTAARSLAAGHATHIGLFYANPSDAYLTQFLVGALESARRAGCHLVIEVCEGESADAQAEATRAFASTDVEGVILPPPISEYDPVHAELAVAGIPVVSVARARASGDELNVGIDDYAAALTMTRYLLGLGHRDIGFVRGHPGHMASAERQRGFSDALAEHGLDPEQAPVEQGYFSYRSGLFAAERLLARRPRPTAIFASNDDMAAAAVSVAHRSGLDVPGDISIVGFDDTALATTLWPELTTIRQPIAAMADAALTLLLAQLRGGGTSKPPERLLDFEFIERDSAGPPPETARAADQRNP